MTFITRLAMAFAIIASFAVAAFADTLRAHGPNPGGGSYIATVAIGKMAEEHAGIPMQLQAGQTGTRSMVALSRGEIDFTLLPIPAVNFFKNGQAMYANMAEAPELYKNLRGILVWECCAWHFMTYAEDGMTEMSDFAGKRIFTGPPGSVAKRLLETMIFASTGLEADTDYTPVNLDWGSGTQAFRDRHMDVYINPVQLGGSLVEEISVSRDVRLIGLPPVEGNEALAKAVGTPGNMLIEIPAGLYTGQVNEGPVATVALRHIAGVGVHTDEETIYQITKAVWENIDEFYSYGDFLRKVNPELAFQDMNVPLHAGAYRYYVEAGWSVPESLKPPEAN